MRVHFEVMRTIFFWMETRFACVGFKPAQAVVTQHTLPFSFGTKSTTVNDLALMINSTFPQIGVMLVVEASHKPVTFCTSKNGSCALAFARFVPQRYVPHTEQGAAGRAEMGPIAWRT